MVTVPDWAASPLWEPASVVAPLWVEASPLCAASSPLWAPLCAPVESVPEEVAWVVAAPVTRTGRKSICEEERIRSSVSLSG